MTVKELIERLQKLPPDAVVVKRYDDRGNRREFVEINDWLDPFEIHQSADRSDYHWWEHRGDEAHAAELTVKMGVAV
jgi:hypothetical protein